MVKGGNGILVMVRVMFLVGIRVGIRFLVIAWVRLTVGVGFLVRVWVRVRVGIRFLVVAWVRLTVGVGFLVGIIVKWWFGIMVGAGVGVGAGVALRMRVLDFLFDSNEVMSVLLIVVCIARIFLVRCLWLLISSWSLCSVSCESSIWKWYAGISLSIIVVVVVVVPSEVVVYFVTVVESVVVIVVFRAVSSSNSSFQFEFFLIKSVCYYSRDVCQNLSIFVC